MFDGMSLDPTSCAFKNSEKDDESLLCAFLIQPLHIHQKILIFILQQRGINNHGWRHWDQNFVTEQGDCKKDIDTHACMIINIDIMEIQRR